MCGEPLKSPGADCEKPINTKQCLTGYSCRWCNMSVHTTCMAKIQGWNLMCTLGDFAPCLLYKTGIVGNEGYGWLWLYGVGFVALARFWSGGRLAARGGAIYYYVRCPRPSAVDVSNDQPIPCGLPVCLSSWWFLAPFADRCVRAIDWVELLVFVCFRGGHHQVHAL